MQLNGICSLKILEGQWLLDGVFFSTRIDCKKKNEIENGQLRPKGVFGDHPFNYFFINHISIN